MHPKLKKVTSWILSFITAFAFFQISAFAEPENTAVMQLKIKNDSLALYLSQDNSKLELHDLLSGHVWKSYITPDQLPESPNRQWENTIQSLCLVDYASAKDSKGNAQTARSYEYRKYITSEVSDNRLVLHFNLSKLFIRFDVAFTLEDHAMSVIIPEDSIQETLTKNKLVSISVLPFFGATFDKDKGYYVYPNGSGEVFQFKEQKYRQNALKEYIIPYYGNDKVEMQQLLTGENFNAMLPAYGVKVGNTAFAALIKDGAYDAQLHVTPSGVSVGVNRMYNTFLYRRQYSITGSKISASGKDKEKNLGTMFETERVSGNRSIQYLFLNQDQADYSGMATAIRNTLQTDGYLKKNVKVNSQAPIAIDLVGGVTKKSFIFTDFIAMTTFSQATNIIKDLLDHDVKNLSVNYNGWSKNGVAKAPSAYKAAFKLGGKKGLNQFSLFCEQQSVPLNLQVNFVNAVKDQGKFSLNQDVARDPNGYMYTDDESKNYLIRPSKISDLNQKLLKYLNLGFVGITYDKLGSYLYKDKTNQDFARAKSAETFNQIVAAGDKKLTVAQVIGGNLYLLKNVNMARGISEKSKGIALSDYSVPFYQMVVHGSVSYTGSPMNLYYNTAKQKLEMVEYGFTPYYEITAESPRKLKNTDYSSLFTSEYAQWKDDILNTVEEFNPLAEFYGEYMVKHERLSATLAAVTYSNGKTVIVNYADTAASYHGISIAKESFQVMDKGE